jgi:acetyltransferase-like isoleucine patch superfamily enzyme
MKSEIKVQKMGTSDDSYIVTCLHFSNNDEIKLNDIIVTYESSKAEFDVESEFEGFIIFLCKVGDKVSVGDVIAIVYDSKESLLSSISNDSNSERDSNNGFMISDKAQKLLSEHDLNPADIGKSNIKEKDVLNFLLSKNSVRKISFVKAKSNLRTLVNLDNVILTCFSYEIGDSVKFGKNVVIECDKLVLGNNVIISDNVVIKGKNVIIGDYSRIGSNSTITFGLYEGDLIVGKRCMIGSNSYINIERNVVFEDDVCISSDVKLITHRQWHSVFLGGESFFSGITLKFNSFIGPGTIIMPGVTIGEWTTVLANSSVIQNLDSMILAGGVPAIKIKDIKISNNLSINKKIDILFNIIQNISAMHFNYNWDIDQIDDDLTFRFSNRDLKLCFNMSVIYNLDSLVKKNDKELVLLLEGYLPDGFEGIDIMHHTLKVNNKSIREFLYKSFFMCGVHLNCI